jgi:hypothetical protein
MNAVGYPDRCDSNCELGCLLPQRPDRACCVISLVADVLHNSSRGINIVPKCASFHPGSPIHRGESHQTGLYRLRRAITFTQTGVIERAAYPRVKILYEKPMPSLVVRAPRVITVAARAAAGADGQGARQQESGHPGRGFSKNETRFHGGNSSLWAYRCYVSALGFRLRSGAWSSESSK